MRHARLKPTLSIGLLAIAGDFACLLRRPGIAGQMPAVAVAAFASSPRCNSAGLDHNFRRS